MIPRFVVNFRHPQSQSTMHNTLIRPSRHQNPSLSLSPRKLPTAEHSTIGNFRPLPVPCPTSTSSTVRGHRRAGRSRTRSCASLTTRMTVLRQEVLAAATRPKARAAAT